MFLKIYALSPKMINYTKLFIDNFAINFNFYAIAIYNLAGKPDLFILCQVKSIFFAEVHF